MYMMWTGSITWLSLTGGSWMETSLQNRDRRRNGHEEWTEFGSEGMLQLGKREMEIEREKAREREREKVKEESLCYRSYHCPCFPYGSCLSTFLLFYTRLLPIYTIIYSTQCTLYKWGWSDWQTVPGDSGSTHCPLQMKMSLIQSNHEFFFFQW